MSRVLIVDDREADRELLATVIRYAGHEVIEARDGHEALALFRTAVPDLFVSDVLMPGMDGYELVRCIRAERGVVQPPVIFCTANYLSSEAEDLARACGVEQVLVKPVEPETILAAVAAALRSGAQPIPEQAEHFDREHLKLVSGKLLEKVAELEVVDRARRRLLADLVNSQEIERERIASEIHDDSLQVMAAVALSVEALASQIEESADRNAADELAGTVRAAIARLRRLTFDLHPHSLDREPLAGVLEDYLREVAPEAGLEWELVERGSGELPVEIKTILFRIAQEALRNVRKHALARRVELSLHEDETGVELRVVDDGGGFEVSEQTIYRPGHLGLASIRERAENAGGRFELRSAPAAGTSLTVWVPLEAPRTPEIPLLAEGLG